MGHSKEWVTRISYFLGFFVEIVQHPKLLCTLKWIMVMRFIVPLHYKKVPILNYIV